MSTCRRRRAGDTSPAQCTTVPPRAATTASGSASCRRIVSGIASGKRSHIAVLPTMSVNRNAIVTRSAVPTPVSTIQATVLPPQGGGCRAGLGTAGRRVPAAGAPASILAVAEVVVAPDAAERSPVPTTVDLDELPGFVLAIAGLPHRRNLICPIGRAGSRRVGGCGDGARPSRRPREECTRDVTTAPHPPASSARPTSRNSKRPPPARSESVIPESGL